MSSPVAARPQTGLLRGDLATIARIHRCSLSHVRQVALGMRPGRAALRATIEKYRARAAAAQAETAATSARLFHLQQRKVS